jgi:hypothetical protein
MCMGQYGMFNCEILYMLSLNFFTFHAAYEACHLEPVYKAVWVSPMKSFSELMTGELHEVISRSS